MYNIYIFRLGLWWRLSPAGHSFASPSRYIYISHHLLIQSMMSYLLDDDLVGCCQLHSFPFAVWIVFWSTRHLRCVPALSVDTLMPSRDAWVSIPGIHILNYGVSTLLISTQYLTFLYVFLWRKTMCHQSKCLYGRLDSISAVARLHAFPISWRLIGIRPFVICNLSAYHDLTRLGIQ